MTLRWGCFNERTFMDEGAVERVLGTMVAAKLYGHDLRLRALGRKNYESRVKLWCVRCWVSREFTCTEDSNGDIPEWSQPCATKRAG